MRHVAASLVASVATAALLPMAEAAPVQVATPDHERAGAHAVVATDDAPPPVPESVTLRRGTRAWRVGVVLAKREWRQRFTTTTGRQVTLFATSRDRTGRRAFVADIRCGGRLVARGFGRRGTKVRLRFVRPPSSCVLRFRAGKQKVRYRATLAVSNR